MTEVGEVLRARVHERMYGRFRSNAAIARALGMDPSEFHRKIHGQRPWFLRDVVALAEQLETTVGWLIGETDKP
ncbi:helix-turn-helix domain-containing protein [Lysinibacter sp. HNR]|uniref:helix-turn-helix domain-containing protein n=1 Tax=Lysinibacter sp. HNR TaxID=3031408 RepID=UPI0024351B93|nr:helix-turn-helix domain-containing protein [Lysinibacter sp. HNR]WGD37599.1 helix-turn-helix domain-containing protein [Lysinibacter sp. HNR]